MASEQTGLAFSLPLTYERELYFQSAIITMYVLSINYETLNIDCPLHFKTNERLKMCCINKVFRVNIQYITVYLKLSFVK